MAAPPPFLERVPLDTLRTWRGNQPAGTPLRRGAEAELARRGEEQPEGRRRGRSDDLAIQSALGGAGRRRRTLLLGGGSEFN